MNYIALITALLHKASLSFRSFWSRPNNEKLLAAAALFFASWALLSTALFLTSFLWFSFKMAVFVYAAARALQSFLQGTDIIKAFSLAFEDFQCVLNAQPDERLSFIGDFLYEYLITGPVNTFNFFKDLYQGKERPSSAPSDSFVSNSVSGFFIGLFGYKAFSLGIAGGIHFALHAAWIGALLTTSSYLAQLSFRPEKFKNDIENFNNLTRWSERFTFVQNFFIGRVDNGLALLTHFINWLKEVPETLRNDQKEALKALPLARLEAMRQTVSHCIVQESPVSGLGEDSDDECNSRDSDYSRARHSALQNFGGNTRSVILSRSSSREILSKEKPQVLI